MSPTHYGVRCGTPRGYRRHVRRGEVTCRACCDAYAAHRALERAGGPVEVELAEEIERPLQYAAALAGREVAEALTPPDRAGLVRELHRRGWTDVEIAQHTRMTTFTAAEIRGRLGLLPNSPSDATSTRGVA